MDDRVREQILELCSNHGWEVIVPNVKGFLVRSYDPEMRGLDTTLEKQITESWSAKVLQAQIAGKRAPHNGKLVECVNYAVNSDEEVEFDFIVLKVSP